MQWASRLTVASAIVIAGACGGSTSSSNNNGQTSGDGGPTDASLGSPDAMGDDDGGSDGAEPPDNGPWPAAHFPMPQFIDLGGNVLASPKVITVTFVGNTNRDALRAFDDQMLQDPWWGQVTQGYGIGAATGGVYVELPDTVSNTTLDDTQDIQPMIAKWVASEALPPPDSNTLYMIYFPSTTTITLQGTTSCQYFGAYHNSGPVPLEAGTVDTAYAIMPDCGDGLPEIQLSASHELVEASTDPHPETSTAWYGYNDAWFATLGQTGGQGEVADVCQSSRYVTDTAGNYLSRSWSNSAAMASQDPCQPETTGEIFFALAVPTQNAASKTVSGMTSGGYLPMKQGQTQTLDSVIFSDAQLPSDVQLTVGTKGHGALGPLGGGIIATLTPTAGHNGMHVALTIQVPMSTPSTDYPGLVRATLATAATSVDAAPTSTHHDWPFIIRVHEATD